MTTSLTLKNIPDSVYDRLKQSALANRRSMNSEAIICLEAALRPGRVTTDEKLERIRSVRVDLGGRFGADDIDALKRDGRP